MNDLSILKKLATATASEQELLVFRQWLRTCPPEEYELVLEKYESILLQQDVEEVHNEQWLQQLMESVAEERRAGKSRLGRIVHSRRTWWVAASVTIIIALVTYFNNDNRFRDDRVVKKPLPRDFTAPQVNRASIRLADGTMVYLDSAGNGPLAVLGDVKLVKLQNGQIAYQTADHRIVNVPQYNTLTNPRGSKVIDIRLSDGSHVWLNAGSSLSYPVAFGNDARRVELTGEGYFEVAKDASRKFFVTCKGIQTEVLGTHFNISGFAEDPVAKVTLLEGSIKVSAAEKMGRAHILKPGEQAQVGSQFRTVQVDADKVMAWKNGYFSLDGSSFSEIMHQLERWYNVEVIYTSGIPGVELFGKIGRDLNLSEVVNSLKDMGVNCRIDQGRLVVL